MKILAVTFILAAAIGCSSTPKKMVIDSSSNNKPSWTNLNKITWEDGGKVMLKATHTVRGDERPDGCIDLAKLDAKENLISEIKNDVRGSLDNAQQSISNDAEVILGKVRSSEFEGQLKGLRFEESFWEKYRTADNEQSITCHVLAKLSREDYLANKRAIVNKVQAIDPRVKEAVTKKQIDFFKTTRPEAKDQSVE